MATVAADRGEDRRCGRHHMCFLNTTWTDGVDINKWARRWTNLCRTVGRKQARFSGVAATANRVRCGKRTGVGRRHHRCSGDTDHKRPGGRQGCVVPQEEDHSGVAEERPQGIASALLELFRRLLQIAYRTYWVRDLQQPRSFHSGPVRRGEADKTTRPRMSLREDKLKGESNESVAEGDIGLQTSARRGRREYTAQAIATITSDEDPRANSKS